MVITPLDAEKAKFRLAFRGYAREDVERFRAGIIAALEEQIARIQELSAKVSALEKEVQRYRGSEDLLRDSVVLAQRTSDELIAAAHKQADAIKHEAHAEGGQISQKYAELRMQREQFEYAFHGLLTGFVTRLEQGNPRLAGAREERRELGEAVPEDEPPAAAPLAVDTGEETSIPEASPVPPQHQDVPPRSIPTVPTPTFAPVPRVPDARRDTGNIPAGEGERDADIASFTAAIDEASTSGDAPWPERKADNGGGSES